MEKEKESSRDWNLLSVQVIELQITLQGAQQNWWFEFLFICRQEIIFDDSGDNLIGIGTKEHIARV